MPLDDEEREIKFWEKTRALLEAENELVGKRIGWFLTFQGLLCAAYAVSLQSSPTLSSLAANLRFYFAAIGIVSSGAVLIAMNAAEAVVHDRISEWKTRPAEIRGRATLPSPYGRTYAVRGGGVFLMLMPIALSLSWWRFAHDPRLTRALVVTSICTATFAAIQRGPEIHRAAARALPLLQTQLRCGSTRNWIARLRRHGLAFMQRIDREYRPALHAGSRRGRLTNVNETPSRHK